MMPVVELEVFDIDIDVRISRSIRIQFANVGSRSECHTQCDIDDLLT